ncbi:3'(2')5'-bisphosphate nucleotidase 1, partial [Dissostichus eleginoides]
GRGVREGRMSLPPFKIVRGIAAPGSCHPNAILPPFITCWTARHVTGRASWRVTGLINLVWQLPDARSGSSPPSLSRSHIPVSRGPIANMIYSLENVHLLPKRPFQWMGTASVKACSCQSNLATSLSDVAQGEPSFLGQWSL